MLTIHRSSHANPCLLRCGQHCVAGRVSSRLRSSRGQEEEEEEEEEEEGEGEEEDGKKEE